MRSRRRWSSEFMLWCNGGGSACASRRIDGSTDGPEMDASRNQLRQLGGQYDIRAHIQPHQVAEAAERALGGL